jgi:tetratricopeptide (TPR) repeat protein
MSAHGDYKAIRAKATEHLNARRYAPALELFLEAEPLASDSELCGLLGDLAVAYHNVGNTRGAVQTYDRAIATCRHQRDDVNLSRWCQNLALIRIAEGALDQAQDLLAEAISAAQRSGDAYQLSTALGNRAVAFMEERAFAPAVSALEDAERAAANSPNLRAHWRQTLVSVNSAWAMELVDRRAWQQARARAEAGLEYAGTANDEDKIERAKLHSILFGIAYECGDFNAAEVEREQAVALLHAAGRPDLASGLVGH